MEPRRSSTAPHSLMVSILSCGYDWCVCSSQREQWTVCSASLQSQHARVHDASLLQVHLQAAVASSQPEYNGMFMSCQMGDWVCREVAVSLSSSPLGSLTVAEQGFGFPTRRWTEVTLFFFQNWARRSTDFMISLSTKRSADITTS